MKRIVLLIPTSRFTESAVNLTFTALLFSELVILDLKTNILVYLFQIVMSSFGLH